MPFPGQCSLLRFMMLLCWGLSCPSSWVLCQDKMGPNKSMWLSHQRHLCLSHLWFRGIGIEMHDWWYTLFFVLFAFCFVILLCCFLVLQTRLSKWVFFACTSSITYTFREDEEFLGLSSNYSLRGNSTWVDKEGPFCVWLRCSGHIWLVLSSSESRLCQMLHVNRDFSLTTNLAWKCPAVQNGKNRMNWKRNL